MYLDTGTGARYVLVVQPMISKRSDGWSVTYRSDLGALVTRHGFGSEWRARHWARVAGVSL